MPNPAGLNTTVIHMKYVEPNATATPLQGTLTFSPTPSPILFPTQNVIVAGTETVTLDVNGEATIELISTDQAGENPTGWLYTVTEKITGQKQRTFNIALPYNSGVTVELSDIAPTDAAPTYIPVVGPQGAPGVITTINGHSAATVNLTAADVGAIATTAINAANGVPGLDANKKLGVGTTTPSARTQIQSIVDEIGLLVQQTSATVTQPVMLVQSSHATDNAFSASVGGDTQNRFNFTAGGNLTWGPGNANTDVGLYRSSSGNLNTTGQLSSDQAAPTLASHFTRKDYVDGLDGANVKLTGAQTIAGAKTFSAAGNFTVSLQTAQLGVGVAPGGARVNVQSTVDEIVALLQQTATAPTSSVLRIMTAAATDSALGVRVPADTVHRLNILTSGAINWGPGSAATDTSLSRSAVNELTASGQLVVAAATPTAAGHVTRKDYVDNNFSSLTGTQTISGTKTFTAPPNFNRSSASSLALQTSVTGDTFARLAVNADGKISWGPGNANGDVTLSRSAAGILALAGELQVQNSAIGSVALASVVIGNGFDSWRTYADGKQEWGSGTAARDTNFYRSAAGQLKTDTALIVGTDLTVNGNINSATNLVMGAWATYTPSWTASTNPAIGNGNLTGRYQLTGKTCTVKIFLQIGSTTTMGSGAWSFGLPFTAVAGATSNDGYVGAAFGSRSTWHSGTVLVHSGANSCVVSDAGSGSVWSATVPATWATGDYIIITMDFEIA